MTEQPHHGPNDHPQRHVQSSPPQTYNLVWDLSCAVRYTLGNQHLACRDISRRVVGSAGKHVYITTYMPAVFSEIRKEFGVTDQDMLDEWESTEVSKNAAGLGSGKSGSLFVKSVHHKMILKTLNKKEKDKLVQMSLKLMQHLKMYPGSFLNRILCLSKVISKNEKYYFCIFYDIFTSIPQCGSPQRVFDLKGARVNRKSKSSALKSDDTIRMDLDEPRIFKVEEEIRNRIVQQINLDSNFLAKFNCMDYSLLIGVCYRNPDILDTEEEGKKQNKKSNTKKKKKSKHAKKRREDLEVEGEAESEIIETKKPDKDNGTIDFESIWKTGVPSAEPSSDAGTLEFFRLGIIDYLQDYNSFKKTAHALKVYIYCTISGLSTVEPIYYAERYEQMIEQKFPKQGT